MRDSVNAVLPTDTMYRSVSRHWYCVIKILYRTVRLCITIYRCADITFQPF